MQNINESIKDHVCYLAISEKVQKKVKELVLRRKDLGFETKIKGYFIVISFCGSNVYVSDKADYHEESEQWVLGSDAYNAGNITLTKPMNDFLNAHHSKCIWEVK